MLLAKELTEIITALKYLVKLCFESPQRITLYMLYLINLTIKYEPLMCYAEAITNNLNFLSNLRMLRGSCKNFSPTIYVTGNSWE